MVIVRHCHENLESYILSIDLKVLTSIFLKGEYHVIYVTHYRYIISALEVAGHELMLLMLNIYYF